jgi:hypothetical protein
MYFMQVPYDNLNPVTINKYFLRYVNASRLNHRIIFISC